VFVQATALALSLAAYVGWLGCVSSLAEQVPAPSAPPGGATTSSKASSSAAKEPPAKEKHVPPQGADQPKDKLKPSASKESKEPRTKEQHPNVSTHKDIDIRLPGLPTPRTGPIVIHTPGVVLPRSLGSPLPSTRIPPPAFTPPPSGAARLRHTVPQPSDAARNAFGAVTHHGAGVSGTMPRMPGAVVAPAPNYGVINGTAMAPRGAGPATIGGPARKAGVINGTTIRPRP
jgi:hypothetical protein